jgi:hypothetical protein
VLSNCSRMQNVIGGTVIFSTYFQKSAQSHGSCAPQGSTRRCRPKSKDDMIETSCSNNCSLRRSRQVDQSQIHTYMIVVLHLVRRWLRGFEGSSSRPSSPPTSKALVCPLVDQQVLTTNLTYRRLRDWTTAWIVLDALSSSPAPSFSGQLPRYMKTTR